MRAYPIWQMKYCTQTVLVDTSKVSREKVYIYFVADRNHLDLYSFDGSRVRDKCEIISNGKIYCYNIPFEWLENEGVLPQVLVDAREKEYEKYKNYMAKNKKDKSEKK